MKAKPNLLCRWLMGVDQDNEALLIWVDEEGQMREVYNTVDLDHLVHAYRKSDTDPWAELVETVGRSRAAEPCNCNIYNLDGQVHDRDEVVLDRPEWMPDGERVNGVPVDACIANVVEHLWAKGVKTWGSCCGHNGRFGPPALLLDRSEDIRAVRALIAEVDQRIWSLEWVRVADHPQGCE